MRRDGGGGGELRRGPDDVHALSHHGHALRPPPHGQGAGLLTPPLLPSLGKVDRGRGVGAGQTKREYRIDGKTLRETIVREDAAGSQLESVKYFYKTKAYPVF